MLQQTGLRADEAPARLTVRGDSGVRAHSLQAALSASLAVPTPVPAGAECNLMGSACGMDGQSVCRVLYNYVCVDGWGWECGMGEFGVQDVCGWRGWVCGAPDR